MENKTKRPLLAYLILTYLLTKLLLFAALLARDSFLYHQFGYIVMFCPGIAAYITSRLCKIGAGEIGLRFAKVRCYALGAVLPVVYLGVSYGVYWIVQPGSYRGPAAATGAGIIAIPLFILCALGEELGWRGFLSPVMTDRFGFAKGAVYTGLIWGAWHLTLGNPFIYERYFYPGATIVFVLQGVLLSILMNSLRVRSGSVLPAAIFHGFHNYVLLNVLDPVTLGTRKAYLVGEVGVVTLAVTAVLAGAALLADQKRRRIRSLIE